MDNVIFFFILLFKRIFWLYTWSLWKVSQSCRTKTKAVPDNDTTSVWLRPTLANFWVIVSKESVGKGSPLFAPVWFATSPSLLPKNTFHVFPPLCKGFLLSFIPADTLYFCFFQWLYVAMKVCLYIYIEKYCIVLTRRTESRAAMASMSAQETTPGHALSTELFIVSTTSNPLTEFKLGKADFSPSLPSSKTDPSQP